mmetsp:Transcript_17080/g.53590  ORF Transcript_17080/g.53590 Transcript_17080/m.53590 type:complete len:264 (-) Transcript_17080:839-1630(-)
MNGIEASGLRGESKSSKPSSDKCGGRLGASAPVPLGEVLSGDARGEEGRNSGVRPTSRWSLSPPETCRAIRPLEKSREACCRSKPCSVAEAEPAAVPSPATASAASKQDSMICSSLLACVGRSLPWSSRYMREPISYSVSPHSAPICRSLVATSISRRQSRCTPRHLASSRASFGPLSILMYSSSFSSKGLWACGQDIQARSSLKTSSRSGIDKPWSMGTSSYLELPRPCRTRRFPSFRSMFTMRMSNMPMRWTSAVLKTWGA